MPKILIVDDNRQNLEGLEILLKARGHDVSKAENGLDALHQAKVALPDIIVTDILMPEMDGFELCRQWKADKTLKQKPFVFYTATYTDPRDEELAEKLGADCFVKKPTKPMELIQQLEDTLESYSTNDLPHESRIDDTGYLQQHNRVLVRKLEDKVRELQRVNEQLHEQIRCLEQAQTDLRVKDRALSATPAGIVITDPRREDNPIIYCNAAFEKITGYEAEKVIGQNCRFLQKDDRDQPELNQLRLAIQQQKGCQVVLRNYKQDGTMFWNRLTIAPVHDESGLTHFLGIQKDVTDQLRIEKDAKAAAVAAAKVAMLSPREKEVFEEVVLGRPNKSIARRLDISIKTVEAHRAHLMKKLHVRNLPDLVRLATSAERASD